MQFTTVTLLTTLLSLASAAPTILAERASPCPGQSYLTADVQCPSGFIGCVAYDQAGAVCQGPKRFFSEWSGRVSVMR